MLISESASKYRHLSYLVAFVLALNNLKIMKVSNKYFFRPGLDEKLEKLRLLYQTISFTLL